MFNCVSAQTIEPEDIGKQTGLTQPHTTHCLANGEIMISCLGDYNNKGEGKGIQTNYYYYYFFSSLIFILY